MYCMYKQLHPPSGIEHAVYCNLLSPTEQHLVIASVNVLQVYRLNDDVEQADKDNESKSWKQKLECVCQFTLFGNVREMRPLKVVGQPRDSLLLCFKDAKTSLVEYDPNTHDLRTSSLQYYEHANLRNGLSQRNHFPPMLRTDPEGRCAAMLAYGSKLVIMPLKRDLQTGVNLDSAAGGGDVDLLSPTGDFSSNVRSPVLASYVIDLRSFDEKITNVKDFQFLPGYYEPTIFILFEPLPTWSGRVAVRKDSFNIVALSVNLHQKVHPIIWSLSGLPFDCLQVFPVPKPIGGVLIFAANSLLYLNQSVPPYGVSLNAATNVSTDFILKQQEGVHITLDCAHAEFISGEKLVISLKGGELYVLTLVVDSMRSVRSFNFEKAAASVLTTCMSLCESGYLFLGSRLGNSLLLKYTEKVREESQATAESTVVEASVKKEEQAEVKEDKDEKAKDEPAAKRKKTDNLDEWVATDVSKMADKDELEVYGNEANANTQIVSYSFEVCDSIMNIGPCGTVVMGEPAFLSEEFISEGEHDIELVSTSGYAKNGALSVLQRSIRPQIVTTFELPDCQDMWTLVGPPDLTKSVEEDKTISKNHQYLLMSRGDSSMILETGQEIMELDSSGFYTDIATVFAGNIGDDRFIVQVTATSVILMKSIKRLSETFLDVESPVVSCSLADPYLLLLTASGEVRCLSLIGAEESDVTNVRLELVTPPVTQSCLSLCCYRDVSGIFTTEPQQTVPTNITTVQPGITSTKVASKTTFDDDVDDEDALLYGDSDISMTQQLQQSDPIQTPADINDISMKFERPTYNTDPTYWAAIATSDGYLKIYSMPEWTQVFTACAFTQGHGIVKDMSQSDTPFIERKDPIGSAMKVNELLLCGLGSKNRRPHLFARIGEDMLLYEAFPHNSTDDNIDNYDPYQNISGRRLQLRFKLVPHGLITRQRKAPPSRGTENRDKEVFSVSKWFRPFHDVAGYSGVFLCCPYPHWIIMTYRGILRFHPMSIDGSVKCFAEFQNVNCPKGFLYFNKTNDLRISVLPTHLSYDAPWPVRKVPLRRTVYNIVYHPDSKTYCVVSSVGEPCNQVVHIQGEGEKETEFVEKNDERFILPTVEKFSVQLFSPVSWEAIPNTDHTFEEFEHVTCSQYVKLKSEGTISGLKGYMVVGTNYSYSEDVTSRGRILIFDIIDVVPEPGQPLTKNKMKIEYDKEQKGPVTAVNFVSGFLITAIGQKIYIWQLLNEDLIGVAFIDTNIYIHSITVVRSLILAADIAKSITLLRYKEDLKVLSLISKDNNPLDVYAAEFMVDNSNLCTLVSDSDKNLIVFAYLPEVKESCGGQWLLRKADFNVGNHINTFWRIRSKITDPSVDRKLTGNITRRQITFFASLDGSLGYVSPVTEKIYRRFAMLQTILNKELPHYAGLNPKSYRQFHTDESLLTNIHRGILDGDLLWKYLHLPRTDKVELAKRIGSCPEQLVDNLLELDRTTAHF